MQHRGEHLAIDSALHGDGTGGKLNDDSATTMRRFVVNPGRW